MAVSLQNVTQILVSTHTENKLREISLANSFQSVAPTEENYQTHNEFIRIMKQPRLIYYSAS